MERRILDFGVNTSFEESAERRNIHYSTPISPNLVRRAGDGSMLLTREEAWKEAKVAVVARANSVVPDKSPVITDPRYAAVLGPG